MSNEEVGKALARDGFLCSASDYLDHSDFLTQIFYCVTSPCKPVTFALIAQRAGRSSLQSDYFP